MSVVDVFFDITSYWHAGTGRGSGADADAVVFTTPGGLPCLPGKTVKGLLRDGMLRAVDAKLTVEAEVLRWFGGASARARVSSRDRVQEMEAERFVTRPGALRFDAAVVGATPADSATWEAWGAANERDRERFFHYLASTRLDEHGVAADKTLRRIQVSVPMALRAEVSCDEASDDSWIDRLTEAAIFMDGLGSHRNRGLGRVSVTVVRR